MKIPIFQIPTIFCGWRHNSREWGTARLGRADRAWPGPWYIRVTRRSLPSAKPGPRHSISQAVCPSWPATFSHPFRSCLRAVAPPPPPPPPPPPRNFEGHNVLVCPCLAVSSGSRPLSAGGVRSRVCHGPYTGLRIPLVRVGSVVP